MSEQTATVHTPTFSVVSAVYNVAQYLPDFIASFDKQTHPASDIEIIIVNDGSTDNSLEILEKWADRDARVQVHSKPNGGQGSARNAGIEWARGEWLTFTDPDDMLDEQYFSRVADFISKNPSSEMVATNRIYFQEHLGRLQDGHPLKWMYHGPDAEYNLNEDPSRFPNSVQACFFRRELINAHHLRFDDRVQPTFEDGHFCTHYLLNCSQPRVGFMKTAKYFYRKRADESGTLATSQSDIRKYIDVPRYGYLDALKTAKEKYGAVPEWLQNLMVYDLSWYLSAEESPSVVTAAVGEVTVEVIGLFKEIRTYLDDEVIENFNARPLKPLWRDALTHGLADQPWVSKQAVITQRDEPRNQVQVSVRYCGPVPEVVYYVAGKPTQPISWKDRAVEYFNHALLHEIIAWIPADGTLRVVVNGRPVEISRYWAGRRQLVATPATIKRMFERRSRLVTTLQRSVGAMMNRIENRPDKHLPSHVWTFATKKMKTRKRFRPGQQAVYVAAASPRAKTKYRDAWVLMDRIHDASDNAEELFHYLRENRTDINAWFVLAKGTPDWERLKASGETHLVAHGSFEWRVLMMHCRNLISSHIDVPIYQPVEILRLRKPTWNFTFLQHGVVQSDLSRWFNTKNPAVFVTSTPAEYQSIVEQGSPYIHTSKEVQLTGLARFDRLREYSQEISPDQRDIILFAPTWRQWLTMPGKDPKNRQARVLRDDFLESEFAVQWLSVIQSEELRQLCEEYQLTLGFMAHSNIKPALPQLNFPEYITTFTYADDVKPLIARTKLLMTDYSSVAFDTAYADRPVVYYQFDRETFLGGGHIGRPGYFDYYRDGFGPVVATPEEALAAIRHILAQNGCADQVYTERTQTAFPNRDGRCRERITAAIEALEIPRDLTNPLQVWAKRARTGVKLLHSSGQSPDK